MDWSAAFLDNWGYKVAALVLAVLLWFNVSAGERRDQPVRTRLDFVVTDTSWVVVDVPTEATTNFQGRRRDISRLILDQPRLRYVIDSVTAPVMRILLQPEMVSYDPELGVRPTDVRPSAVELLFEPRVTREVQVEPVIEASAASGFVIVGVPELDPATVTVRGRESEVEGLVAVPTERLSLRNVARTETYRLALLLSPEPTSMSVEPQSVLATIEVDSLVERTLEVPLRATGAAADGVRLERDRILVLVRGAARRVRSLTVAALAATVRVNRRPDGPTVLPVRIILEEGAGVVAVPDPPRVSVTPLPAGEETPDGGVPETEGEE
jgi:YbbR domain-containing protein